VDAQQPELLLVKLGYFSVPCLFQDVVTYIIDFLCRLPVDVIFYLIHFLVLISVSHVRFT